MVIILIGVTGSGKTTVGRLLAAELGWSFYDADNFHPPENIIKMQSGIALSDTDREPWLRALENLIRELSTNRVVLACSALKAVYRNRLSIAAGRGNQQFIYLSVPASVAAERLRQREGHFMPATLVPSQFEALEEPTVALHINATLNPEEIVNEIRKKLAI